MAWSSSAGWEAQQGWNAASSAGPVDTTPIFLGGGTNATITPGTSPRTTTVAAAPAGSVIIVYCASDGTNTQSSFADANGNTYTKTPGGPVNLGSFRIDCWATGPIGAQLNSGSSIGPNLSGSGNVYMLIVAFPGATVLDPEVPAFNSGVATATATVNLPANATQPQYVLFGVIASSQATPAGLTATYTSIGGTVGENGGLGWLCWYQKLTATSGSPTTFTATFTSGGGGVAWTAGVRAVTVVN